MKKKKTRKKETTDHYSSKTLTYTTPLEKKRTGAPI